MYKQAAHTYVYIVHTYFIEVHTSNIKSPPFDSATTSFLHGACAFRKSSHHFARNARRAAHAARTVWRGAGATAVQTCARAHTNASKRRRHVGKAKSPNFVQKIRGYNGYTKRQMLPFGIL